MKSIPSDKEMQAVLALDAQGRYTHWIKRVADGEVVWGLWKDDGWAIVSDTASGVVTALPVWPHAKYAALCATGVWTGYQPKEIPLDAWLTRWLPGLQRDGRKVAIFPTPKGAGAIVEPTRVEAQLREELELYE